ncbi:hypothetical protein DPMN_014434 [Dreissena polymorpha]|uniref:Uncharacterized protein n=1 Tax=Dreissena polymorpha TaxID=45954 RepID=A0A9D4S4J9_DREPO|nr:hypothetical protein DPMN_014434 [Dreissena polymorpha]
MELLVNNLPSLAVAAVAIAIFIRSSAVLVPSLDKVAPKYLELVAFTYFSPFMVMYPLALFVLFTMIFDIFRADLQPYAPALL